MRTRLNRLFREEHGVVAPLVALMLVAFIGMAALTIDVGRLYAQRADLQHSMDAAALAGATAFIRGGLLRARHYPRIKLRPLPRQLPAPMGIPVPRRKFSQGLRLMTLASVVSSSRLQIFYLPSVLNSSQWTWVLSQLRELGGQKGFTVKAI